MTFRRKLLITSALTVFFSVAAVGYLVSFVAGKAFAQTEEDRTAALVAQFQHEFARQGDEVVHRLQAIAASEPVSRIAVALEQARRNWPRISIWRESWRRITSSISWRSSTPTEKLFLRRSGRRSSAIPTPRFQNLPRRVRGRILETGGIAGLDRLGLFAVRATRISEHPVYVIGGRRLDRNFLYSASTCQRTCVPCSIRTATIIFRPTLLDRLLRAMVQTACGPADKFATLVKAVRQYNQEMTGIVSWSSDQADEEVFHAIPLRGTGKDRPLLGDFAGWKFAAVLRRTEASHSCVGVAGRRRRDLSGDPAEQLGGRTRDASSGAIGRRGAGSGRGKLGHASGYARATTRSRNSRESFNRMTTELLAQKERLVQTERVAAWRELARRLAHELKNPLFPLQLTVENLMRARTQSPEQFDEVFRESREHAAGGDFEPQEDHRPLQ